MKKSPKGFTLIELILAIVVLSIGLMGVLSVMLISVNNSVSPELKWQINNLGENVTQVLLNKKADLTNECIAKSNPDFSSVCDYQGIKQQPINTYFGFLTQDVNNANNIKISIDVAPYPANHSAMLISVVLSHAALGDTYFSAIKGMSDAQSPRLYAD